MSKLDECSQRYQETLQRILTESRNEFELYNSAFNNCMSKEDKIKCEPLKKALEQVEYSYTSYKNFSENNFKKCALLSIYK